MKKLRVLSTTLALMLAIGAVSSGCSKSGSSSGGTQKTLVVANWKGYGSDTAYAVETFEKANNCKVVHQYFTSEDELVIMLQQGGVGKVDVMLPNLAYMQQMINDNLAEALDISKLENYDDIVKSMKTQKDLQDSKGNIYGIPWVWGTTALAYDPSKITVKPTSISILWDSKYKGQVAFNDDYTTAILTAAMYLKSEDPYNPDLDAVKKALIEAKQNSKLLWASFDDFSKAYTSGSVAVGNLWSGAATKLVADGEKLDYLYPAEGAIEWQDNWCIVKDSPNKDLAYNSVTPQQVDTSIIAERRGSPGGQALSPP